MDGISKTALGVGSLRALHRLVDAEPWVIDDPVSLALFGDAARYLAQRDPSSLTEPARVRLRAHVLVRSAFAEDRLRAAVARGVRRCVILGAGYDTFAYRQPAWMGAPAAAARYLGRRRDALRLPARESIAAAIVTRSTR